MLDRLQAGLARDGRAKRNAVIGEALLRIMLQDDREPKKISQPLADRGRIMQVKLGRRATVRPNLQFLEGSVERATQLMNARRATFPSRSIIA